MVLIDLQVSTIVLVLIGKLDLYLVVMNTTVERGWTRWAVRTRLVIVGNQRHRGNFRFDSCIHAKKLFKILIDVVGF
jgi:hypothetical protein